MKRSTKQWNSPSLGGKAKVHVYGTGGTPVLFFNSGCDKTDADKEFLSSVAYQIENGLNQIYTLQKPDYKLVFDKDIEPSRRIVEFMHLESFITDELIPRIHQETDNSFIIVAGVGDGGYLAMNLMLKHPSVFDKCISVCGRYDMRPDFDGSVSDDFYYNNPIEFLPNLTDPYFLSDLRTRDIRIISHASDEYIQQAEVLSEYLLNKDIDHNLDIWGGEYPLDHEARKNMFANHIP